MSDSLARRLLSLPVEGQGRSTNPSQLTMERLTRATQQVNVEVAQFASTLEYIHAVTQFGKEDHELRRNSKMHLTSTQQSDIANNYSLAERVAIVVKEHDGEEVTSLLKPAEERTVQDLAIEFAERSHSMSNLNPNLWFLHYGCILYQKRAGWALETRFTKLNYPVNDPYWRDDAGIFANKLSESKLGRKSLIVVGLPNQGKSALCGRLVQALGRCPLRSIARVQSAARRQSKNPSIDEACWMVDRSVLERTYQTTYQTKEFPVYHSKIGSFTVVDTPPFANCESLPSKEASLSSQMTSRISATASLAQSRGSLRRMQHSPLPADHIPPENYPSFEVRRRQVTAALTLTTENDLVVICVAANGISDKTEEEEGNDEDLLHLVCQVRAATKWPQASVVFAVTKMDSVDWDPTSFEATAQRIRRIAGQNVTIVPTSALVPAYGIVLPHTAATSSSRKRKWPEAAIQGMPSSILSLAFETMLPRKPDTISSAISYDGMANAPTIVYVLERYSRKEGMVFLVKVVQGTLSLGQMVRLKIRETQRVRRGFGWWWEKVLEYKKDVRIDSIEWYGHPCSTAHVGQIVGIGTQSVGRVILQRVLTPSQEITNMVQERAEVTLVEVMSRLYLGETLPLKGYRPEVILYPMQHDISIHDEMKILRKASGTDDNSLIVVSQFRPSQVSSFFLGQRVLLFRSRLDKKLVGFGVVSRLGDDTLSTEHKTHALEWLSRDLRIGEEKTPEIVPPHISTPLPIPKPLPLDRRNISTVSALSMGLQSIESLPYRAPATTVDEAIRQTDKVISSMLRLKEQLEKAKSLKDQHHDHDETSSSCYMCLQACPVSSDPTAVSICYRCDSLNCLKREEELKFPENSTVIITGARIKIGYATVERLLTATGVTTLVLTTRFPFLLAEQLYRDHSEALEKIAVHIYGVDFRSVGAVTVLGEHLAKYYPSVFALINNAAQTIRRPAAFYLPIVEKELALSTQGDHSLRQLVKTVGTNPNENGSTHHSEALSPPTTSVVRTFRDCQMFPINCSALMTQCQVLEEDVVPSNEVAANLFPIVDEIDEATGERVLDLREATSWRKSILPTRESNETVEAVEFLEVLLVNTLAPFILLKSLIGPLKETGGNVINVSSREGVFARVKQAEHPHTNAAKAGLNMLTRTAAYELQQVNIMICSVDPGWVSKNRKFSFRPDGTRKGKVPPLTMQDGAARILDPIMERIKDQTKGRRKPRNGTFFRNFEATPFM